MAIKQLFAEIVQRLLRDLQKLREENDLLIGSRKVASNLFENSALLSDMN